MIPSTKIAQIVLLNGSAQMDKRIARALDKKYILTTSSPEPLVHIEHNFTEFFPHDAFYQIAQMAPLC